MKALSVIASALVVLTWCEGLRAQHVLELPAYGISPPMAFSPDGKYLALAENGSPKKLIAVWDIEKKEKLCRLEPPMGPRFCAFPDNDTIAVVFHRKIYVKPGVEVEPGIEVVFYDLKTNAKKKEHFFPGRVYVMAFSQNARFLVMRPIPESTERAPTPEETVILVHDLASKKTLTLQGDKYRLWAARVSDDGKYLATYAFKVRLWSLPDCKLLWEKRLDLHSQEDPFHFIKKNEVLAAVDAGGRYQFLSISNGKEAFKAHEMSYHGRASMDAKWILTDYSRWTRDEDKIILPGEPNPGVGLRFVDPKTGKVVHKIAIKEEEGGWQWTPRNTSIVLSPDGRYAAIDGIPRRGKLAVGSPSVRIFEIPKSLR